MKASDYNSISIKLQKKLGQAERATYRILNVRPDPDNYGRELMPAAVQIPSTDKVYDKQADQFIDIACIDRTTIDGAPVFADIVFSASSMGYIFLVGTNPLHQKMYQYMELCNYNESNPNRNQDVDAIFKRIDTKKDAINEREMRKVVVKAVNAALDLDDEKVKQVAYALGMEFESTEEMRNALEDYATDSPNEFLEVLERASLTTETIVKEAMKANIIRNNVNSSCFEWVETEKEIYKYKKSPNKNYIKEFAEYLEEQNQDELNAITTRVR